MADVNRLRRIKRSCQKMRSCRRLGVLRAVVIPSEPPDRSSRFRNDLPVAPREGSKTARWCFGLASPLALTLKPLLACHAEGASGASAAAVARKFRKIRASLLLFDEGEGWEESETSVVQTALAEVRYFGAPSGPGPPGSSLGTTL
ncbi:hypothetical protein MRX96_047879 [Rhipicephalus microplus]